MMSEMLEGGCLCGAIRYTVDVPIEKLVACHCSDCRKSTGTGASINAVIPAVAFQLTKGQPKVFRGTADSGNVLLRCFCGDCGSPLFSRHEGNEDILILKAGSLDAAPEAKLAINIWTRSRPAWALMDESLPSFETSRPKPPPPA